MSLITPSELITELYPEVVNQITRYENSTEAPANAEAQKHIDDSEAFIKSFLFKYDLVKLFGTKTEQPTVVDDALKKCVKVCASWFLVRKANPNVNMDVFYQDFLFWIGTEEDPGWLYGIRDGKINPNWPYPVDDPDTPDDESEANNEVYWTSTKKRENRF